MSHMTSKYPLDNKMNTRLYISTIFCMLFISMQANGLQNKIEIGRLVFFLWNT